MHACMYAVSSSHVLAVHMLCACYRETQETVETTVMKDTVESKEPMDLMVSEVIPAGLDHLGSQDSLE